MGGGVRWILTSTQVVREIAELVTKTHRTLPQRTTRQMTLSRRRINFVYHSNFAFILPSYYTILAPCLRNISHAKLDYSVSQIRRCGFFLLLGALRVWLYWIALVHRGSRVAADVFLLGLHKTAPEPFYNQSSTEDLARVARV